MTTGDISQEQQHLTCGQGNLSSVINGINESKREKGGGWLFNYDQHHVSDCQTKEEEGLAGKQEEESVNI